MKLEITLTPEQVRQIVEAERQKAEPTIEYLEVVEESGRRG